MKSDKLVFNKKDNKTKFEMLYKRYGSVLYKFAFNILKDSYLAEDAVHEAFMKIANNLHKIDDIYSHKTLNFLITIVKNVSLTMYAKRKVRNSLMYDDINDNIEDIACSLEESVIAQGSYEELLDIIKNLKEELRQPFLLRYIEDLSDKEISQLLNITQNNTVVRIHRAKAKLRVLIKSEENSGKTDVNK